MKTYLNRQREKKWKFFNRFSMVFGHILFTICWMVRHLCGYTKRRNDNKQTKKTFYATVSPFSSFILKKNKEYEEQPCKRQPMTASTARFAEKINRQRNCNLLLRSKFENKTIQTNKHHGSDWIKCSIRVKKTCVYPYFCNNKNTLLLWIPFLI